MAGADDSRLGRGAGVGVAEEYVGECAESVAEGLRLEAAIGMPDKRRVPVAERDVLPTELPRLLDPPPPALGVRRPPVYPVRITEDAGELPGVPRRLVLAGLSAVIMLDIESRNCWLLEIVVSSSTESITFMLALRASTR